MGKCKSQWRQFFPLVPKLWLGNGFIGIEAGASAQLCSQAGAWEQGKVDAGAWEQAGFPLPLWEGIKGRGM